MSRNYQIREDEKIIGVYRRCGFVYFGTVFLALLLTLIPFFLLTLLLSYGFVGVIVFSVLLATALYFCAVKFIRWHGNKTIITNRRIIDIDRRAMFDSRVSEIFFRDIVDVSHRVRGLRPTLFGYGTVRIQASGAVTVEMRDIKKPHEAVDLINELREMNRADEENNELRNEAR